MKVENVFSICSKLWSLRSQNIKVFTLIWYLVPASSCDSYFDVYLLARFFMGTSHGRNFSLRPAIFALLRATPPQSCSPASLWSNFFLYYSPVVIVSEEPPFFPLTKINIAATMRLGILPVIIVSPFTGVPVVPGVSSGWRDANCVSQPFKKVTRSSCTAGAIAFTRRLGEIT